MRQGALQTILLLNVVITATNGQPQHQSNAQAHALRAAKANEFLMNLNLTADPCKDFYEFACGKWAHAHQASLSRDDITTPVQLLQQRLNKDLEELLSAPTRQLKADSTPLKDLFRTCMQVASNGAEQQTFLTSFIRKHGGLPSIPGTWNVINYNWISVIAALRMNYGIEILIGIDIDNAGERANSIFLTEPKTTLLPRELCSALAEQSAIYHESDYEQLQREVSRNMQRWFKLISADANRYAGDIIRFEFGICAHMRQHDSMRLESPANRVGMARLHGIPQAYGYPRNSAKQFTMKFDSVIDFKYLIDTIFNTVINDHIYMRTEAYFRNLAQKLKHTNKLTLAYYIMYRAIESLNLPNDDRSDKRAQYCVTLVRQFFPKTLGNLYQEHQLQQHMHRDAIANDLTNIFADITKVFEQSLKNEWLPENSRRAAKQKLMQIQAGFPVYTESNEFNNLALDRKNFWDNLQQLMKLKSQNELGRLYKIEDYRISSNTMDMLEATDIAVQAYPLENLILVGWGLMQAPFYQTFYSNALKFSLLGQYLARELVMAFDEQRWNANTMGALRWDQTTLENYRNRSECFRVQYSNYLFNRPDAFHNASKLRELVADSAGLRIAFGAYLAWLDRFLPPNLHKLINETLPGVHFTNTQLFFINFAQMRCYAKHEEPGSSAIAAMLPLNSHTNERYMVNGPLSNFDEFAREFNCRPHTAMNIDDKCVVY